MKEKKIGGETEGKTFVYMVYWYHLNLHSNNTWIINDTGVKQKLYNRAQLVHILNFLR